MSGKLQWIEAGRGLAALAVAVSHVAAPMVFLGNVGVAFFFSLSGFIIFHIHRADLGHPDRALHFAKRRVLRIFPTYWLVLAFALSVRQFLGNSDYAISVGPEFLISQILLLPHVPFVGVAWTLRHEMLFYGMFLLMILNRRIGAAVFFVWFVAILFSQQWLNSCELLTIGIPQCGTGEMPLLAGRFNLYFFVGMGVGIALQRNRVLPLAICLSSGAGLGFASNVLSGSIMALAAGQFLACASLLCWAVWASAQQYRTPRLLMWLGSISYPFYLVHVTMLLIAYGILKRLGLPTSPVQFVVGILAALVAAELIVRFFEKPLFQSVLRGKKARLQS